MGKELETNQNVITSELLRKIGLILPGRETHIPLVVEPYSITQEQKSFYEFALSILTRVMLKAQAFRLNGEKVDDNYLVILQELQQIPFIWRFDLLATPGDNGQHQHKMLELNATRPGGLWLLLKAAEVYQELGKGKNLWIPTIDILGEYFLSLAARKEDTNPVVGLGWTPGYVAQIEMPKLTQLLNKWATEGGFPIRFISASRDRFFLDQEKGRIIGPQGEEITVFYENAAPEENANVNRGGFFKFPFNQLEETLLINPPLTATTDDKILMAYLFNPDFRRILTREEIEIVEALVPPTFPIRTVEEFMEFFKQNDPSLYFFKISNGARASSGRGVYNGEYLRENKNAIREIAQALQNGEIFIVQQRIPPKKPWIPTTIIAEKEGIEEKFVFADVDPFVMSDGEKIRVPGALCREKPEHPINLSQGGGLSCVKIDTK